MLNNSLVMDKIVNRQSSNGHNCDKAEGVGGKTVEIWNRRGGYFQPKIVIHVFYQQ